MEGTHRKVVSMSKIVVVSARQVSAARCLARISGGLHKVDPLIAKIATAEPATSEQKRLAKQAEPHILCPSHDCRATGHLGWRTVGPSVYGCLINTGPAVSFGYQGSVFY